MRPPRRSDEGKKKQDRCCPWVASASVGCFFLPLSGLTCRFFSSWGYFFVFVSFRWWVSLVDVSFLAGGSLSPVRCRRPLFSFPVCHKIVVTTDTLSFFVYVPLIMHRLFCRISSLKTPTTYSKSKGPSFPSLPPTRILPPSVLVPTRQHRQRPAARPCVRMCGTASYKGRGAPRWPIGMQ